MVLINALSFFSTFIFFTSWSSETAHLPRPDFGELFGLVSRHDIQTYGVFSVCFC